MKKSIFYLLLVAVVLFASCTNENPKAEINVWYGENQEFGKIGNTQRQINILGNIASEIEHIQAWFTLNDDTAKNILTLGSDLHRLALKGDFNVEIERNELNEGENLVEIFVADSSKIITSTHVMVNYTRKNSWPLPYKIEWKNVKNIQDVVEVVDGHWELTDKGVRTKIMYYDRVLALGDASWENYEVQTTVTFHDFVLPAKGPPTYNVSHAAIASRWPGHDKDEFQPNRKWFPVGATSEFRLTSDYDSCRWRIFDGENFYAEQKTDAYKKIIANHTYHLKHRVETISEGETRYSVKLWLLNEQEPEKWDFQAIEKNPEKETGSALLIAHNTNVTFGDVYVIPLPYE